MAEHTPGPWEHNGVLVHHPGEDGATICALSEPRATNFVHYTPLALGSPDRLEAYANGRLIAAAPELLAACEHSLAFLRALSGYAPNVGVANRALTALLERAIAQARGEEAPESPYRVP